MNTSPNTELPTLNSRKLCVLDLGLTRYRDVYRFQKELVRLRWQEKIPDCLIFNEHHPVYTLGRSGHEKHLKDQNFIEENKADVIKIDRGGDVTFHGPGQLTIYPIIHLGYFKKDILCFIKTLENILIQGLIAFGVKGMTQAGRTGVWLNPAQKIASIGLGFSHWVSYHGIALNIETDLRFFRAIHPCGFEDISMCNLKDQKLQNISPENGIFQVRKIIESLFIDFFKYDSVVSRHEYALDELWNGRH